MKLKKLLVTALALAMLLSTFSFSTVAQAEDGLTFESNTVYRIEEKFETAPKTYEAWIKLPESVASDGGGIIANEGFDNFHIQFGIAGGGTPRLKYYASDKTTKDLIFTQVDVRGNEWKHLAITFDAAKKQAICYLNGEAVQTLAVTLDFHQLAAYIPMAIGGTQIPANRDYFKGSIRSVTVYSDVRTADEIKADMTAVNTASDHILAHYDLNGAAEKSVIENACSSQYTVTKATVWITRDEKEPVTDYDYSFCIVGDTQIVTLKSAGVLKSLYQWIARNKDEKKISYVFGMGDITDKDTNDEWKIAKQFVDQLNGIVPYSLIRGNHDSAAQFNATFNTEAYKSNFNGFYGENDICNSWVTFRAGNVDYLHITLDYGPSDAILNWASDIIEAHPKHRVIISTHAYLDEDGTTVDYTNPVAPNKTGINNGVTNNGDQMWDKLIKQHENIFMVFSGHIGSTDIIMTQTEGVHGNVVTQFLVNPQITDVRYRATGMVAMLYFSNDGKTVTVEQYSTNDKKFFMSSSQFTVTVPEYEHAVKEEDPSDPIETTDATNDAVTEAPTAEATTTAGTTAGASNSKGGCSGSVCAGAVALIPMIAFVAAVLPRRKRK